MTIDLRSDLNAARLYAEVRQTRHPRHRLRLLAIARIYAGEKRGEVAQSLGIGPKVLWGWITRFNEQGLDGLATGLRPGRRPRFTDAQRASLAAAMASGPDPDLDGTDTWTMATLCAWLHRRHGINVCVRTVSRELKRLGVSVRSHAHGRRAAWRAPPQDDASSDLPRRHTGRSLQARYPLAEAAASPPA